MSEKRSLGGAMEITPAKLAFIKGEAETTVEQVATPVSNAEPKTTTVEIPRKQVDFPRETTQRPARRVTRRSNFVAPGASEVLDQVLVPVTIRLPRRTAQALKRAYLEQRLNDVKPDTQQEIAEEALTDWLEKAGYLI